MQLYRTSLRCLVACGALFFASLTWAVDAFTVRDIRIEGLQRVEPGTVFMSMPLRIGDVYDDEKGTAIIRALFALGLFKDVRLEVNGDVLVVVVEERPSVAEVSFKGNKEFDKDILGKALQEVGLAYGRPLDKAQLDRAEQELKQQYINRGFYSAEVVTTVTPLEKNRVDLTFNVVEGRTAKISEVRIVGNRAFDEATLKGLLNQNSGGWLSWYTKSNRYAKSKLNADIETLRSFYLTQGYLEFKVDSTQVAIAPNKTDISITINVSEGDRFVVRSVRLEGDFLGKDDEFKTLVTIKPGKPYNAEEVAETTKAFTDYFGNFGYAFAQIEARPNIDRPNKWVDLVLQANPSRRFYVRKINIAGNSRTRDVVIRRELRQLEASWYDGRKIRASRDRVDRLGFFKEVGVDTREVAGVPDQVDLVFTVVEKPTGNAFLGAGFSSADGFGVSFGINEDNILGTGNSLGLQVNTSKTNRVVVVNTTDPYYTEDGVSRTFDLYHKSVSPYQGTDSYKLVTTGTSIRFGVPFTEFDRVYLGVGVEQTEVVPGTYTPESYLPYVDKRNQALPLTLGWSSDSRDSALAPNRGRFQSVNAEWSVEGDTRYVRTTYQFQQYWPLSKKYTLAFNVDLGWGAGTNGQSFPVFKHFYGGGLGSVRGFAQGSLGPKDGAGTVEGGSSRYNLNLEVLTPFPGAGNDRTIRMYGFLDLGAVRGDNPSTPTQNDPRASVGLGISWFSPVGPLRIAYARPVRKFDGDKMQSVQFQIGTSF